MRALTKKDWLNLTPGDLVAVAWTSSAYKEGVYTWLLFIGHTRIKRSPPFLTANFVDLSNPSDLGCWIFDQFYYLPNKARR
jgi:hypothetical protein